MSDSLVRVTRAGENKPQTASESAPLLAVQPDAPNEALARPTAALSKTPAIPQERPLADIPGLDAVGHGIYLRPHQPHELKRVLFKRKDYRPIAFKDAEELYYLPAGYEVDDSPPMPANQLLNQVMIEESFDRFSKQMSLDATLAVGGGAFSINATASQTKQMRTNEEAYYALRSSCIPLWSLYLSDTDTIIEEVNTYSIPVPFKHEHRAAYERFFERFGSHYVKRVWLGGKAQLFLTISKSSGMTKEEIQAGLKASYSSFGKGEANSRLEVSREKLQSSSQCSVAGKGGDELKLAALSSLDESKYNEWISTIRANPQTIEMEVAGIWTLMDQKEKAQALRDAYHEATSFSAISAAFAVDKTVYFVRGRKYFCYSIEKQESEKPKLLVDKWPVLGPLGMDRIDAAFSGRDLISAEGERLNRKLFFIRKDQVVRLDIDSGAIDPGYPKLLKEAFPGVEFERIDSALEIGRDTIFLFSGNRYVRFSIKQNRVEEGYPDFVARRWPGVTFERLDAAIYWGNGKVYFFKEDNHIRFDLVTCSADPGYPKQIVGNYVEDWRFFD